MSTLDDAIESLRFEVAEAEAHGTGADIPSAAAWRPILVELERQAMRIERLDRLINIYDNAADAMLDEGYCGGVYRAVLDRAHETAPPLSGPAESEESPWSRPPESSAAPFSQ